MNTTPSPNHSIPWPRARSPHAGHRGPLFYGWWIVFTAAAALFWGVPITVYSFPVFLRPLMHNFHAGRAEISLAYTVQLFVSALSTPLTGWLIDRFGPRKIILPFTAIYGVLLLSNKAFSASLGHFYLFYAAVGLVSHGSGVIPYGYVISHWFDRRRGLALGVMMLGIGAGAMMMPSFSQRLITAYGWQTTYAIFGSLVLLTSVPLVAVVLKEKPQDLGLLPDGVRPAPEGASPSNFTARKGMSAREAWHTAAFWLMASAFFLVSASVQGCLVHTTAMLSDRGIPPQTAALASSLIGAAVLTGRVGTGYLLDRLFAPHLAAVFFGVVGLGIALFWLGTTPVAFAGAFLIGLGLGAEVDIIAYLTSRYFGLRAFGKVYASAFAAFAFGGALGPALMGAAFDWTGTYRIPLLAFLIATLLAAVLMIRLGPYRYVPEHTKVSLPQPQPDRLPA